MGLEIATRCLAWLVFCRQGRKPAASVENGLRETKQKTDRTFSLSRGIYKDGGFLEHADTFSSCLILVEVADDLVDRVRFASISEALCY